MAMFRKSKKDKGYQRDAASPQNAAKAGTQRGALAYRTLVRPHVTEKAGRLSDKNQYVFRVADRATKPEIAQAIQEAYGVRPVRVTTSRIPGKPRRLGKTEGRVKGYKKATVTLPEGKRIEVLPR